MPENLILKQQLIDMIENIAGIGYWSVDLKTEKVYWSKAIHIIHGTDPNTYVPDLQSGISFYHPNDRQNVEQALALAIENKDAFDFRLRIVRTNKEIIYVRSRGECRFDKNGNVTALMGLFFDVTEDERDEQIAQLYYGVKQGNQDNFMDTATDGFWDWYIQDNYQYMSPRFWDIFGFKPEEKAHHPNAWQNLIYPEDLAVATKNLELHQASKGAHPYLQEVRYKHKKGHTVTVLCRGKIIEWDEQGRGVRMIGTHTDITEIKRTEQALRLANEELETFAYRTSHDLRSPLLSAQKLISLSQDAIAAGNVEEAGHYLAVVHQSLGKLENLVNDILTMTRVDSERGSDTEVDIEQLINQILEDIKFTDGYADVNVNIITDKDLKSFFGRRDLILTICENLIVNAIKYRDTKKPNMKLTINISSSFQSLKMAFEDNGLGIPSEHQEKVFQMFNRFHPKVSFGSGLGLYIVKKSVNRLQGTVEFKPLEDGSCFEVELPYYSSSDLSNN